VQINHTLSSPVQVNDHGWPLWPQYNSQLRQDLNNVVESGRWAISGYWTGQECMERNFSEAFAAFNHVPYCTPTTSGSSALMISLEALGIGFGDEVIVPAFTWIATATAVLNVNAKPILVDVDPDTYCIDINKIEEVITEHTKAIIPVHIYGCMSDMDSILAIAKKYNLAVVEDCAQSHGSIWNGKRAGTIGDIGIFSMQQGKVLTSGEGGAVLTKNKQLYEKIEQLRSDSRVLLDRDQLNYGDKQLISKGEIQGSNYCLSEFQAAILVNQLQDLDHMNQRKNKAAAYLDKELLQIDGIKVLKQYEQETQPTYYGYAIRFEKKHFGDLHPKEICGMLQKELKLGSFYIHSPYPPIHQSPLYCPWTKSRYPKSIALNENYWRSLQFPIAENVQNEAVVFHHAILLSDEDKLSKIVDAFKKLENLCN
jgi:L-glutamine:2-deoxy-scyllo-inosose/3-amino-2,3-dideoxy-scyllo-inosose aminotransferase